MIELALTIACGLFLVWFFGTLLVIGLGLLNIILESIFGGK